jgi:putative SOS response-associated peptidase YedK
MCCRYLILRAHLKEMLARLGVRELAEQASRYNIAPGSEIPVVRASSGTGLCELALSRWGLVPAWTKADATGVGLVNARAESLAEKPSFRDAFRARRCLVPASGYYEWKIAGKARQPWLFQLRGERPFFLAGLWESWTGPEGTAHETCAVITTKSNELMQPIHHRMPAILPVDAAELWLAPTRQPEELAANLLRVFPAEAMIARPVSTRVNSVTHDDEGCLAPAEPSGHEQLAWDLP